MKTLAVLGMVAVLGGCATVPDPMMSAIEEERQALLGLAVTPMEVAQVNQYTEQKKLNYMAQKMQVERVRTDGMEASMRMIQMGFCMSNPGACR